MISDAMIDQPFYLTSMVNEEAFNSQDAPLVWKKDSIDCNT
jgi:hypothetical protein